MPENKGALSLAEEEGSGLKQFVLNQPRASRHTGLRPGQHRDAS